MKYGKPETVTMKWDVRVASDLYEMGARGLVRAVQHAYPVGSIIHVRRRRGTIAAEVIGHNEAWWHNPGQLRVRNLKTLTETNASYEAIIERA